MKTKYCNKCSSTLNASEFNKCSRNKCGLQSFCKKCKKAMSAKRYTNKKEHILDINKTWRDNNKEYKKTLNSRWRMVNKERRRATAAKRRAKKLKATPSWADNNAIMDFYLNCPEGYEVDHIIPLQGKNVSGFHVETNLQYLTISENRSKGNKYESN